MTISEAKINSNEHSWVTLLNLWAVIPHYLKQLYFLVPRAIVWDTAEIFSGHVHRYLLTPEAPDFWKDDLWFSSGSLESSTEGYSSAHKGRWVHGEAAVVSHPEKSLQHYQRHPGTVRAERGDGGSQPCTSTSRSPLACACSFYETNSEVIFKQKNRAGHKKNGLHNRGRGVPANTADTQPRPQLQKRSWELPCPPRSASKKSAQLSLETRFAKEKYFF